MFHSNSDKPLSSCVVPNLPLRPAICNAWEGDITTCSLPFLNLSLLNNIWTNYTKMLFCLWWLILESVAVLTVSCEIKKEFNNKNNNNIKQKSPAKTTRKAQDVVRGNVSFSTHININPVIIIPKQMVIIFIFDSMQTTYPILVSL